jgi:hypothetical protein
VTQSPSGTVFVVRRSLWSILMNLVLGLGLAGLTVANVVYQLRTGGSWTVAGMFAFIAVFFLWQAIDQLRDRSPLVEIGPSGLRLRLASPDPIPWSRIWHAHATRGPLNFGGGRLDFQVDPAVFLRLKFGQRFMGDIVVKKRGQPNTFSVIAQPLEESADAIFAALKRYWPPDKQDDDSDEGE